MMISGRAFEGVGGVVQSKPPEAVLCIGESVMFLVTKTNTLSGQGHN